MNFYISEGPSRDQNANGPSVVDEGPSRDQNADGPSVVDETWKSRLGGAVEYIHNTRPLSLWHRGDILQAKWTLDKVPESKGNPKIAIDPPLADLTGLFAESPVIMLDTEFSIEIFLTDRQLAYIQLYFVEKNVICIFTYKNKFEGFCEAFLKWLQKENSIVVGFFLLADLSQP